MKPSNVLIFSGIILLLAALFFAFDDHLSELAPLFLLAGVGCFLWLIYRKTWSSGTAVQSPTPSTVLSRISGLLAIAGLLGLGLGGLSLLDDSLQELAAAALVGVLLLIFAVITRIANGIYTRRVDATTGGFSIAVILLLMVALAVVCIGVYVAYLLLFSW